MAVQEHWLGDAELWGLTPGRFAEIRDELEDHVTCTQAREGEDVAREQRAALAAPQARRRLSASYLADQVYATLNRWPTRREWHEFAWLGVWFLLIFASDWVSLQAQDARSAFAMQLRELNGSVGTPFPPASIYLTTAAWLLQGVARAGFFASFAVSLWRACRTGWGVAIARIMQLKLIHTILVVTANSVLGTRLWQYHSIFTVDTDWPLWLTAPLLAGIPLVGAVVVLAVWRRKLWHVALGLVLSAVFLYPAGPYEIQTLRVDRTMAATVARLPNNKYGYVRETNPERLAMITEYYRKQGNLFFSEIDDANNRMICDSESAAELPFHVGSMGHLNYNWYNYPPWGYVQNWYDEIMQPDLPPEMLLEFRVLSSSSSLRSPLSVPGAGLSWLAAPIPVLGVIGFLGLILVMGRRSLPDLLLYTFLALLALVLTILPFSFIDFGNYVEVGANALVYTPCPSFRHMLADDGVTQRWLLGFGLIFSAGIPWLLTSLFLRPGGGRDTGPDEAVAE